jgi:hypothetical protein
VTLRRDRSRATDNGEIAARGKFSTDPPGDTLTTASGIAVDVRDSLGTVVQQTWAATECGKKSSGAVGCRSTNRSARVKLVPIRSTPQAYRFITRLRRLGIHTPFAGPVAVTLSYGAGIDRVGSIGCGNTKSGLTCPP